MIERRGFLKSGFAGLVLAGVAPVLLTSRRSNATDHLLSVPHFSEQLHTWFQLRGEGTHHAKLVRVYDYPADPRLVQFGLVFRGPANDSIAEGLYEVTSARGDRYRLFIQPTGSDAGGAYYRSSVSRFRRLSASSCAGATG